MKSTFLFFNFGGGEIIIVLLVVLLFFGSKKIPELARGLGRGMREFKDATSGVQREIEESMREIPPTKKPHPAVKPLEKKEEKEQPEPLTGS